ncbi:MAG: molybdopterin-dependent oxidoreductase [Acidimicrobiales bacterium]
MGVRGPPGAHQPGRSRRGTFTSPLHSRRTAAILGVALAVAFGVCFLTGLISHVIQQPPSWLSWPPRPAGLYRVTQGLHVSTGIATIPLLLAKLWAAYPGFWSWPPWRDLTHALERLSLVPLVAGSLFLLFSGVGNIAYWRPWGFFFTDAHYWAAWITIGALLVHIGAKASVTRLALSRAGRREDDAALAAHPGGLTRRGFLATTAAASGVLTVATVGQTFRPLRGVSVLAPRDPGVGPQGVPVNKSAAAANVIQAATSPEYRFEVTGAVLEPRSFTLEQLRALPLHQARLPIACVEGWSSEATWRGVRVVDLLSEVGAEDPDSATVRSLQEGGLFGRSELNRLFLRDPDTLLALELNGEPLHIDHGFPLRLIAPNRPGVLQTKWLATMEVR